MGNATKLIEAEDRITQQDLPAGRFSSWLRRIRHTLVKENGADVPCGGCNACCRSFDFIYIRPEESRALARIPRKFLFPAPGLPEGHVIMGYYENGRCPMLIEDKCSIYEHRPRACRDYDCRIFTAAGMAAGGEDKAHITQRVRRWRFSYPTQRDRDQHSAVQTAAKFMREHDECFPAGAGPSNPSQVAILTIKVYEVFLKNIAKSGKIRRVFPDIKIAKAIMAACKKIEAMRIKGGGDGL